MNAGTVEYAGQYEVATTSSGIRCANHGRTRTFHANIDSVKACFAAEREMQADMDAEIAVDRAVERHFEDRGYEDARAQEDYEARNGMVDFTAAWHMASPETCPCSDHRD